MVNSTLDYKEGSFLKVNHPVTHWTDADDKILTDLWLNSLRPIDDLAAETSKTERQVWQRLEDLNIIHKRLSKTR
jgi:hypothetical protein